MRKQKTSANCCIRLPVELHRLAKLEAYKLDTTLQAWVIRLIENELIKIPIRQKLGGFKDKMYNEVTK